MALVVSKGRNTRETMQTNRGMHCSPTHQVRGVVRQHARTRSRSRRPKTFDNPVGGS